MKDPWQLIHRARLPDAVAPSKDDMVAALRAIEATPEPPRGKEKEAFFAFLFSWQKVYPRSFDDSFGTDASAVFELASMSAAYRNSYPKLRRITLKHLQNVL